MDEAIEQLRSGDSAQKMRVLGGLASAHNPDVIGEVMMLLDDDDIQVRGEAFGALVLNENDICDQLLHGLESASKNIRGFVSLVLANRGDAPAIPHMVRLASDERSMVRSCAVGALGHLEAAGADAHDAIFRSLFDPNPEVRKSAAHAAVRAGVRVDADALRRVSDAWAPDVRADPDFGLLLDALRKTPR